MSEQGIVEIHFADPNCLVCKGTGITETGSKCVCWMVSVNKEKKVIGKTIEAKDGSLKLHV